LRIFYCVNPSTTYATIDIRTTITTIVVFILNGCIGWSMGNRLVVDGWSYNLYSTTPSTRSKDNNNHHRCVYIEWVVEWSSIHPFFQILFSYVYMYIVQCTFVQCTSSNIVFKKVNILNHCTTSKNRVL